VQDAQGNFDYGVIVDGTIEGASHTDLPQAAAYARDVLTRRLEPPKVVRCTTYEPGWYPFLSATVTWGARLLSGLFLVTVLRVRAEGIDPAATTHELPYEVELVEGDVLRQSWVDYYRGQNPALGITWGYTPTETPDTMMQWTTNRQFTAPAAGAGVSVTPSGVAWTNSAYAQVTASTDADWLLTGVVVTTVSAGFFGSTWGDFELDVAVGAAASEVVIATVKGLYVSTDSGYGLLPIPIPIDAIPSGSRVAIRMRKYSTDVTPWAFALTYYKAPIVGNLQTTSQPLKLYPTGTVSLSLSANTTAWASSTWTTVIASAAADLVIAGLHIPVLSNSLSWEIDLAVGAAASEVVIATVKGRNTGGDGSTDWFPLPTPLASVTSGSRLSARVRKSNTTSDQQLLSVAYYEAPL
jgi:hypothetical protein